MYWEPDKINNKYKKIVQHSFNKIFQNSKIKHFNLTISQVENRLEHSSTSN